ncbi:MAG TPA: hypothetical protein VIO58_02300 [Candidatus Methanoperedens sp.]
MNRDNKNRVEGSAGESGHLTGIVSMYSTESDTKAHGLSSSQPVYQVTPAITSLTMVVTSNNHAQFGAAANFINPSIHYPARRSFDFIDFQKLIKIVRILGLMSVISYMVVILFTWISANLEGYIYFSAGEPESLIKYPEWALGAIGIFAAFDYLRKELNDEII